MAAGAAADVPAWRARGRLFDGAAEAYADDRPGYPSAIFDILAQRAGLGPGARVVEVGAGAGQATLELAARGASVLALEPGPALAAVLRARVNDLPVEVVDARLEDAVLEPAAFDLAVSATAFHWVQPDVGIARLAAATRPGGCLALWWSVYGAPGRADPFVEALEVRLRVAAPNLVVEGGAAGSYAYDRSSRVAEIVAGRAFGPVEQVVLHWEGRHTPEGLRRMFATFSPWLALEASERERCLDLVLRTAEETAVGGVVVRPYATVLYLAPRR